jgi:hypothetical protein
MLEIQSKIGLWAYQEQQRLSYFHRSSLHNWIETKCFAVLELLVPRCWNDGCKDHGAPCVIRGDDEEQDQVYWYCAKHSQRHGFCWSCGEFYGGTESFDFGPGYCSNCASEFEDEEVYEEDWTYEL